MFRRNLKSLHELFREFIRIYLTDWSFLEAITFKASLFVSIESMFDQVLFIFSNNATECNFSVPLTYMFVERIFIKLSKRKSYLRWNISMEPMLRWEKNFHFVIFLSICINLNLFFPFYLPPFIHLRCYALKFNLVMSELFKMFRAIFSLLHILRDGTRFDDI